MARLAFDTGGTFTDFALIDDNGALHLHKILSTPLDPAEAVIQGIDELLELHADQAPLFAEEEWKRPPMTLESALAEATADYHPGDR